jgi:hypothetical protein
MFPPWENGSVHVGTVTGVLEPEQYEFKVAAGADPAECEQFTITSNRTITKEFF